MISPNTQKTFISGQTKSISSLKVTCLQDAERMLEDDITIQSCIILNVLLATVDHQHGEKDQHLGELFIDCIPKLRNVKGKFL